MAEPANALHDVVTSEVGTSTRRKPVATGEPVAPTQPIEVAEGGCAEREPLFRTSVVELASESDPHLAVKMHALGARPQPPTSFGGGRESALGCD